MIKAMENNNENEKEIAKVTGSFKPERGLADDSYRISVHDFGKKLLYPVKKIEEIMGFENADTGNVGRKGEFIARTPKGQGALIVSYEVDLSSEPVAIDLMFTKNPLSFEPGVSQRIELEIQELAWGTRAYFVCQDCGRRCNVLFLAKGFHNFSCRKCQNLVYESSRLNRRSAMGLVYYINRQARLADKREKIDRPFYKGRRTKRFERFVKMYSQLEKMSQTEKFKDLLKLASVH